MTFNFNAVGTRDDVLRQVRAHNLDNGGHLAATARDVITAALGADEATGLPGEYKYAYVVKASGHTGSGMPTSLNLTIEPQWVPDVPAEVVHVSASDTVRAEDGGERIG